MTILVCYNPSLRGEKNGYNYEKLPTSNKDW